MKPKSILFWWFSSATILVTVTAILWWLHSLQSQNIQLSVKPGMAYSNVQLDALPSSIGIEAKLPYTALERAAERATEKSQTGIGEKQFCKKLLGTNVCATLQWQYLIQRNGEVKIQEKNNQLRLRLPISLSGTVSVDGRQGRLLGLRNKAFDAELDLLADININIRKDWCPVLQSDVSYQWRSDPGITLLGSMRINLRKSVDKALQKRLSELATQLADIIDCTELREKIQQQWRTHQLDIDLKANSTGQLLFTPLTASASKIHLLKDHANLAFDLNAIVKLRQPEPALEITSPTLLQQEPQATVGLPDLIPRTQPPGTVELSLLLDIPYPLLQEKISRETLGKTFRVGNSTDVTVVSLDLFPAKELIIIDIGFTARTFWSLLETTGHVYISARPVADPINNQLQLEDLQLTRRIDSKLLSVITAAFRQQLLAALQQVAVVDLESSMAQIESSVVSSLSNHQNTGGIKLDVDSPVVRLMALNPQKNGLAAVVHLSTRLTATLPDNGLIR